ncbi:MAG: SAM hydrolase/SAM-dependent halogenase family protein [Terriglobia bacterium]
MSALISLTTDFGLRDHFVGTMKGVMLNINPSAQLVDVSHNVTPFDVFDGAVTIALAYRYFPPQTVHLVIVDPGVGTSRRAIVARTREHVFVAPDNGVLSIIYEREEQVEVRHVIADRYFLKPVSNTFHGRDIFAPVAGWLSKGLGPEKFGETVTDYVRLSVPKPKRAGAREIQGVVIKVDQFGNLITNIGPEDVPELFATPPSEFSMSAGQQRITRMYNSYASGKSSEIFAILGSSGFLELGQNHGSAAETLQVSRGAEVKIALGAAHG